MLRCSRCNKENFVISKCNSRSFKWEERKTLRISFFLFLFFNKYSACWCCERQHTRGSKTLSIVNLSFISLTSYLVKPIFVKVKFFHFLRFFRKRYEICVKTFYESIFLLVSENYLLKYTDKIFLLTSARDGKIFFAPPPHPGLAK